jgi:hypothetical protein
LVVLALPTAAASAAGSESGGGGAAFRLQGTHGYAITVLAGVRPGETVGQVVLFVGKPHAEAVYGAPATITASGIEADLGSLGEISLAARPTGVQHTAHPHCGKPIRYEGVSYVGKFEFRGEAGYTRATATNLPGLVEPLLNLICGVSVGGESSGPGLPGASLHLSSQGGAPDVSLLARTNGPRKAVSLSASMRERRGQIKIDRSVYGLYPSSTFTYDPHLSTATLAPPSPFSGRGVFHRGAGAASRWGGNLRIDFPGRSGVAVTGSRYRPVLKHAQWFSKTEASPRLSTPTLSRWLLTKPWPTAFATSLPIAPR